MEPFSKTGLPVIPIDGRTTDSRDANLNSFSLTQTCTSQSPRRVTDRHQECAKIHIWTLTAWATKWFVNFVRLTGPLWATQWFVRSQLSLIAGRERASRAISLINWYWCSYKRSENMCRAVKSRLVSSLWAVAGRSQSVSELIETKSRDSGASKIILQFWAICSGLSHQLETRFHESTRKLVNVRASSPVIPQLLLFYFQASSPQTDSVHSWDTQTCRRAVSRSPPPPPFVVFWCPVPESLSTNMLGHVVFITVTDTNRLLTYCHMLGRKWPVNTNSFARNLSNQQRNLSLIRFMYKYTMYTLRSIENIATKHQLTHTSNSFNSAKVLPN